VQPLAVTTVPRSTAIFVGGDEARFVDWRRRRGADILLNYYCRITRTIVQRVTGENDYVMSFNFIYSYIIFYVFIVTLTASIGKRYVTVWRPSVHLSVYPVSILTVTRQGAACDAARVHFGSTIRKTDILLRVSISVGTTVSLSV